MEAKKPVTLSIKISNKSALYGSYMPWLTGRGMFIPTRQNYELSDLVNLRIELMENPTPYLVSGKVAWITPNAAQGNRTAGIGVQFISDNAGELINQIEKELVDMLNSDRPTHTM